LDGQGLPAILVSAMIDEQRLSLAADDGVVLDARLALPADATVGVAVCHPHPLYGGDMDNPVVVRVIEACAAAGLATLRFNFRGVGRSTGTHDGGRAEQRDLASALDHLAGRFGPDAVAAAGYSFGSLVTAAVVSGRPSLCGVALIAPPLGMVAGQLDGLAATASSLLIVVGALDTYCPRVALDIAMATLPRADVRVLESADHFFGGALDRLGEAVGEWAGRLGARQPGGGRRPC
jgi:alpha/beta superfamily hydrolase